MNGARLVVEMLKAYDVEVIFGVPGDTSIPLYEALYECKSDIRHVMARDERSASFMADAYARISRKPGVCECPSGAGPLYSVPGVAEADASSIPIILITSDIPLSGEGKQTITELDTQKLFESITKWSNVIKHIDKVPEVIRRAFRIAVTGRPGSVHLSIPQEVWTGCVDDESSHIYSEEECRSYPAYRTRGARNTLERLADLMVDAKRPVIIGGGGANHSYAGAAIQGIAEWLSAPVVTTISGQGLIPDDHPLALGVIGDNGFHPHAHKVVEEGDTLLYIGCKMGSVSTINWTMPKNPETKTIIQIDLNPEMLGNNFKNMLSVAGDARLVVEDLAVLLKSRTLLREPTKWVESLNRERAAFWKDAETEFAANDIPIKPQRVIAEVNKHLPEGAIVISDAGTPTPYLSRYLKLSGDGARLIIPRSYGGLGYAVPAVVGAHFARPEAKLVGMFGDGSFGMSAGELETLSRLQIPAVLLHFNNSTFGWIKALQRLHSKGKYFSVDFNANDPALVAEGFGIKSIRIKTPDELVEGLAHAFHEEGPVFVDIVTEPEVDNLPPVYNWLKKSECSV